MRTPIRVILSQMLRKLTMAEAIGCLVAGLIALYDVYDLVTKGPLLGPWTDAGQVEDEPSWVDPPRAP